MAQVQRIDLLQNNFACATAKFPATYPVFLSGKVTRDAFLVRRTDEVGRTLLRKLWGGQVGDKLI